MNAVPPRFSATFDPATQAEIRRAAATGIYDIRGGRISTTCCSWAPRSAAIRLRATANAAAPT
jgi:hypothetical protein